MSLFDDNFVVSMEAKAAPKKEDDDAADPEVKDDAAGDEAEAKDKAPAKDKAEAKEDKVPAESDEECNTEGTDPTPSKTDPEEVPANGDEDPEALEAAIDYAVECDINSESLDEATGFDALISSDREDAHYACMECVTAIIAFDQADVACTEAYTAAGSRYEKSIVTETFKDSVKKFGARFKEFMYKIKNAILRIVNKAVNYIKILSSKISAKFASKVKLDKSKKVPAGVKVRVSAILEKPFKDVAKLATGSSDKAQDQIISTINSIMSKPAADTKAALANLNVPKKSDITNEVLNKGYDDVELASIQGKADGYLADLKKISANADVINNWRKTMEGMLKTCENAVKSSKDIDTEKMNALTASVSKAMSIFNAKVSAMVTLQSAWVNQRVRIIRAIGKYQGTEMPKADDSNPYEGMHESANLFNDFLSML